MLPDLKSNLGAFHVSELLFIFGNEEDVKAKKKPMSTTCLLCGK